MVVRGIIKSKRRNYTIYKGRTEKESKGRIQKKSGKSKGGILLSALLPSLLLLFTFLTFTPGASAEEENTGELKISSELLLSGTYLFTLMRSDKDLSEDEFSVGSGALFTRAGYKSISGEIGVGLWQAPVVGVEGISPRPATSFPSALPMVEIFTAYIEVDVSELGVPLSIQAGRLVTNIGGEVAFTVQNINIQRGILWNAEPVFYNGVRLNVPFGENTFYIGGIRGPFDSEDGKPALEIGLLLQGAENLSVAINSVISDRADTDDRNIANLTVSYEHDVANITFYTDFLSDARFDNKAAGASLLTLIKGGMFGLGLRFEFVYNLDDEDLYGLGKWGGTATLTPTLFIGDRAFVRVEFSSAYSPEEKFTDSEGAPTPFQARIGFEVGGTF